jgi:hypothetical protein
MSQRHAAAVLAVPRRTLQAWRASHARREACPEAVAVCHSVAGLACLHRLVIAFQVVCVEVGACGMRLVCLIWVLTGRHRFVGASYGTQPQVNRSVEDAIVAYRQEERMRRSHEMPRKAITLTQDETLTGGSGWWGSSR